MNRQQHTGPWETEFNDFDFDNVDPETLKAWETEFGPNRPRCGRSYRYRRAFFLSECRLSFFPRKIPAPRDVTMDNAETGMYNRI